jgi:hypothetical protein
MVITKHHRRNKKRKHTQIPFFVVACFFFFYFLLQLFSIFFQGNFKTEQRDQNASNAQLTRHSFSREGRGETIKKILSLGSMVMHRTTHTNLSTKGALGLEQKVYSDSNTRSTQIGATRYTWIQTEALLRFEYKVYLDWSNKVYSDSSTKCTRIRPQEVQIKASNCD